MFLSLPNTEILGKKIRGCASARFAELVPHEVWWIILAGSSLRTLFFFVGENAGCDALARAGITAGWLRHPDSRLIFMMWLPFHFWFIAGMSLLLKNVALGGRLLSLLLGIGSLGAFWILTKEVYGARTAKLSLVVFALYSLHIGYSTTSSSDVPYLFFVLVGLLGFFAYRRSGSHSALTLGAVALGVSSGIRYEAWLFIFAVLLILLFFPSKQVNSRFLGTAHVYEVSLFGVIAGSFPLLLIIYQWKVYGMPLYGATMNHKWVSEQLAVVHRSLLYLWALPPGVILLTLTPVILVAALYGLARGLHHRQGRDFFLISLIVSAVTCYQIVAGGVLPMARYTITVGTLLALASGYGLDEFANFLSQRNAVRLRLAVGIMLILNLGGIFALSVVPNRFTDKFRSISPALRFPRRIESLGQYLKPRLGPNTSVVIDDYNSDWDLIAHVIGLPLLAGNREYTPHPKNVSAVLDYMKRRHPQYVIYSSRGILRAALPLPDQCRVARVLGMNFRCLFENNIYRIYSVSYQHAPEIPVLRSH